MSITEARERRNGGGSIIMTRWAYIGRNLWCIMPALGLFLVLNILFATEAVLVPALPCTSPTEARIVRDPVFCRGSTYLVDILGEKIIDLALEAKPSAVARPTLGELSDDQAKENAKRVVSDNQADEAAAAATLRLKTLAASEAAERLSRARAIGASPAKAAAASPDSVGSAEDTAISKELDVATSAQQEAKARDAVAAGEAMDKVTRHRILTGRAERSLQDWMREARARLRWAVSYGLLIIAAAATVFCAGWVFVMAADDHLNPEGDQTYVWTSRAERLILLLLIANVTFVALAWSLPRLAELVMPADPQARILTITDDFWPPAAAKEFVFQDAVAVLRDRLVNDGSKLVANEYFVIGIAVFILLLALGTTLALTPEQSEQLNALHDALDKPAQPAQPALERYLIRCFERLNVCIYIGAGLLVAGVVHVTAEYSWPAAILGPPQAGEPKAELPEMLEKFANEMMFEYGLAFSVVLASMVLPAWVILRRRAWDVARGRNDPGKSTPELQKWLEDQGMGFTKLQKLAQIAALIAPLGTAELGTVLKSLFEN
jgi:hypothetical protein